MSNAGKHNPGGLEPVEHLYVHIPFCARICPYCAFYKDTLDRSQTERFCQAILREIEWHLEDRAVRPRTMFFGGGTPSALSTKQLELLLQGFATRLDLSALQEWTMEANPGSVSAGKAARLHELGISRLSLGVQSWNNDLLKLLGREHDAAQAKASFRLLREAGFSNINLDLMFGLPGQTREQWRETLETTIALEPEHISAYCLTYEEDTDFFVRHARGELRSNSDLEAEFFQLAIAMLEEAGYEHYEISNYARPGFASAHNRSYWAGEDYLGIGPSAFSTLGMQRLQNVADYRAYADRVLAGQSPVSNVEALTAEAKRAENIALLLRTSSGVPTETLSGFRAQTDEFQELGLLEKTNGRYVLTRAGKSVADTVVEAFI